MSELSELLVECLQIQHRYMLRHEPQVRYLRPRITQVRQTTTHMAGHDAAMLSVATKNHHQIFRHLILASDSSPYSFISSSDDNGSRVALHHIWRHYLPDAHAAQFADLTRAASVIDRWGAVLVGTKNNAVTYMWGCWREVPSIFSDTFRSMDAFVSGMHRHRDHHCTPSIQPLATTIYRRLRTALDGGCSVDTTCLFPAQYTVTPIQNQAAGGHTHVVKPQNVAR